MGNRPLFVVLAFLIYGTFHQTSAQVAQFSQFFAAPVYHNPAFAGGAFAPRLVMNYRNQWPSLDANFQTTSFSIDHHLESLNSGVGISFLDDQQGINRLRNTQVAAQYSYMIKATDDFFIRFGLQAAYAMNQTTSTSNLIFGDQLNANGLTGNPTSDPLKTSTGNQFSYADFSSGILLYNQDMWVGLTANHLTTPNVAINRADISSLPVKYTLTGGINIPLTNPYSSAGLASKEFVATAAFILQKQASSTLFSLGSYLTYSPLTIGLWYRGLPVRREGGSFLNNDAFIGLIGYRMDNFSIGYSYDLTISPLRGTTGGSHEISISYQLDKLQKNIPFYKQRRKEELSCPKF